MSFLNPAVRSDSLATKVPWWGFADENVVLTIHGELMFIAEVLQSPIDAMASADLDHVNRAWQKFLGGVEPPSRVFFVSRRPVEAAPVVVDSDDLSELAQSKRRAHIHRRVRQYRTYVIVVFNPQLNRTISADHSSYIVENIRRWYHTRTQQPHLTVYLRDLIATSLAMAHASWESLAALVSSYTPIRLLPAAEVLPLLHGIVNLDQGEYDASLVARPLGISWTVVREEVAFEPKYMRVGSRVAALYSCCLPPVVAVANCLGDLYSLPVDHTVVLEWRPFDRVTAVKRIRSTQRHYQNLRWSWWAGIQEREGTSLAIEDTAASAQVGELGAARVEIESDGIPYGEVALSVLVAADAPADLDHFGARLSRIFAQMDAKLIRESFGQAAIYFERWPGRASHNLTRPLILSSAAAASLAPVFGPAQGQAFCRHLDAPPLAVFETRYATRYFYDLFGGSDVGHTLLVGRTGSGKSFTVNFLLLQAQQYRPRVLILDLGGSYRWLTAFLKGSYLALDPERTTGDATTGLRPFSLEKSPRTFHFLSAWVARLMNLGGHTPDSAELSDLTDRIEDIYLLPPSERTLSNLVARLPKHVWPSLSRFCGNGAWARWFDGPPVDSESFRFDSDWQVVDLAGAETHPDWCSAALFFLFERMRLQLEDESELSRLKLMIVDEAWRFLSDPVVLGNITEAAKTWRKRNAALVLATQSLVDLSSAGAEPLLDSIPTRLFLSQPDFTDDAARLLKLTQAEAETIRSLESKRELFLQRATERAVVQLTVDPESYWLYTSDPVESHHRRDMVHRWGLSAALARLAAGLPVDPAATDQAAVSKAVMA